MRVSVKRIDPSLPLPQYESSGAACFDLYSRLTLSIPPKSLARIPSNLIISTPPGYGLHIFARSSLAKKKSLILSNGVGVIDSDYCGENDEILIAVYNFSESKTVIKKGERIAQASILKVPKIIFEEVEHVHQKNRGGFGSTGGMTK